jgi:phosphonate degradation associated HDIG domain protein
MSSSADSGVGTVAPAPTRALRADRAAALADIAQILAQAGHQQYSGEPVTQLEHALQTAHLAELALTDKTTATAALITAALLHDLGHLLAPGGPQPEQPDTTHTPSLHGVDDQHQHRVLPYLAQLFGPAVLAPIALHVDAKRYLCHAQPTYAAGLSADSKRSLLLQGGVFDPAQAAHFFALPHAANAVRLRLWDDQAKCAGLATPPLAYYLDTYASQCVVGA